MDIVIEDGVQMPPRKTGPGGGYIATIKSMAPGQSFFMAAVDSKDAQRRSSNINCAVRNLRKQAAFSEVRVATRRVEGGVRVWRLS